MPFELKYLHFLFKKKTKKLWGGKNVSTTNVRLKIMSSSLPAKPINQQISIHPLLMLNCVGTGHLGGNQTNWAQPAWSFPGSPACTICQTFLGTDLRVREKINWEICFYDLLLSPILTIEQPTQIFHSPIICNVLGIKQCLPGGWYPGGIYLGQGEGEGWRRRWGSWLALMIRAHSYWVFIVP